MERDNIWKIVAIGDIIECYFDHHEPDGPEVATRQYRVLDIQTRYGSTASPLIKAVPVDGKTDWYFNDYGYNGFTGSYITKVVSKAKGPHITQRFHAHYYPKNRIITRTDEKGRLFGPFGSIVFDIISTIPGISMTTRIDINRAWKLFLKTKPGFIGIDEPFWRGRGRNPDEVYDDFTMRGWVRVNRKAFKRWLLQNINRMQSTKRELDTWQDMVDKEDYERSMEDFDDMMDRFEARLETERAHEPDPEEEPYDHHPTDDYFPDPEIVTTFDQDARDEAADYAAGHAFLDEQDRLRKMNAEAHGDDRSERYSVEALMGEDADPRRQGPKTIGDLITINQMDEFLEEFKNSSIPTEKIDWARDILRRVRLSTLYPKDVERMGLLGAKIDEYDRIYGEREIKDEHL